MAISLNLVLLGLILAAPGPDGPPSVRVPIAESGEIDAAEVVARLAGRAGLTIDRPRGALKLPINGLGGGLTRTLLEETLGPDVALDIRPRELVITFRDESLDPANLPRLRARIDDLARAARREADRRSRYGMRALKSYRPNDPGRPTVCLVHGMNSSTAGFLHMLKPLEEAGFGLVSYEYPYNQDLDATAPAFARDWAAFRLAAGERRPWAIVAHSMGGLVARHYVEGDSYAGDVSDLVLIAPPNRGSAVAQAQTLLQFINGSRAAKGDEKGAALAELSDGLGAAADDLTPGSAFLKALNARARRPGVGYHILAGDSGFLTKAARQRIEGQLGLASRAKGLIGGLAKLAVGDLTVRLDEVTDGSGDGCVAVASTRLEGVDDHEVIHANHVELIRGPMLYPDPGPVACMPFLLKRLGRPTR